MVETVLGMTDLQIKLFTALGQILVAVVVGFIAYRQWRTARSKLQFDLFDRRLKVYDAIKSVVLRSVPSDWRANVELEMSTALAELRWLFGKPVYDFVWKEIYVPLVDLSEAKATIAEPGPLSQPGVREARDAASARARALRRQLSDSMKVLEEMMSEFLTLTH
ncbi:hypothetical protein [Stenotrophomonas maltophilia]|uniref:hypothetical protein n=1 Tax=Stenotrophomonas maltophilia TaxID=40324 RepID=UPI00027A72A0|nr:hypothetical protein [Stenotrophomonas maltophilia]AVH90212.1 hypothetical protein AL480_04955 [Stenotrophomonas maltophilia]EJP77090.1 hypothetical protein A1OC_01899 [Stenotrophomonas maltophilia Ab55555]ELE7120950.1 hypothetical protein [Stenotrophomonas maltophilia]MBA0233620.1 hypothetical protein [Stenotrophomonas maltophilia]MBA0267153.1 hypothetical protein [Stenotrophomonas maltophilia]